MTQVEDANYPQGCPIDVIRDYENHDPYQPYVWTEAVCIEDRGNEVLVMCTDETQTRLVDLQATRGGSAEREAAAGFYTDKKGRIQRGSPPVWPKRPPAVPLYDRLAKELDEAAAEMNWLNPEVTKAKKAYDEVEEAFSAWSVRVLELHNACYAIDPQRATADNARRKGMI